MYHDRQDLSALIGSRICHDLISPLGAISNGLELLTMTQQETSPELDLISDSINSANAKIRFFRIAYGNTPNGSMIAQPEIVSVLKDYFLDSRLSVTWHPMREVQRREAKVLLLLIQCLKSALPFGGTIDVHHTSDGWTLTALSDKLRADPEQWRLLEGGYPDANLAATQVQFALVADLTKFRRPALTVSISETEIFITL